jgi:hypothetical protein
MSGRVIAPWVWLIAGCLTAGSSGGGGGGDADADADTDADADADTDADADSDTDSGTGSDTGSGTGEDPVDSDGDGFLDDEETDCGSDPADVASTCYACGWRRGDPGDLVSTGNQEGDTVANVTMIDQCGEEVPLWDFAGEYHILFMTAAW